MTDVKGYIIQNAAGSYLSKDYVWFPHDKQGEAFVHPGNKLEWILTESQKWDDAKPTVIIPAICHSETIVLSPINISHLTLAQKLNLVKTRGGL